MDRPENLNWLASRKSGASWLRQLPGLVEDVSAQWNLRLGAAYPKGYVSYVLPAYRNEERLVLKIQWPHDECIHEAEALRVWDGDGAVRLVAHDAKKHALLLEMCSPGTHLAGANVPDPLGVLIGLLPRLWKPVGEPFRTLSDEADEWASALYLERKTARRADERRAIDAALTYITALKDTQGEQVLVHQDFHGDNVLAAEREPWLVIDPKPLRGEREFALAPIIRSFEFGHSRDETLNRLERLSHELRLDRDRALGWAVAQTVAWSLGSGYADRHLETAQWLLDAR